MNLSAFRPVSIGIVAENKDLMSHVVKVLLPEITPFVDGELKSEPVVHEAKGVDADGNAYSEEVTSDSCISAQWLPRGGNRQTAPNVRRGQRVMVYQCGDTDKYYWEYLGRDDGMFRLETIILAINNNPKVDADDTVDLSNCYYFEISTHAQHITLQTCKSNDEPYEYTIQLNTKDGSFVLADDADNFFMLDSRDHLIKMHNTSGAWLELSKKEINAYAPDSVNVVAENNVTFNCQVFDVKASSGVNLTTPNVSISDDCSVGGNLSVGGSFSAGGGGSFGGKITCAGLSATGRVTASNIS